MQSSIPLSSTTSPAFFAAAPPSIDTDIALSKNANTPEIAQSKKILGKGIRPKYTLKNGNPYSKIEEKEVALDGDFNYVIYRDGSSININIDHGSHYFIAEGREKVVIAGDIKFKEGNIVDICNRSGTYHLSEKETMEEYRKLVYETQKSALQSLKVPTDLIDKIHKIAPLKLYNAPKN